MPEIAMIACAAKNDVIGDGPDIPWSIGEEFKHFSETTMGSPCVMGDITYESLPPQLTEQKQYLLDAMEYGDRAEAPNHIDQRMQGQMNVAIETYPAYFDADQLFDTEANPDEMHNLATDPAYADVLAEMKAPGDALLEIVNAQQGRGLVELKLIARFLPRGLAGILYWYSLVPTHRWLFEGMLRAVARRTTTQARRVAVAEITPEPLFEQVRVLGDEPVREVEDAPRGTIVLLQHDDLEAREVLAELQQVLRVGSAPCINRLVIVAHDRECLAYAGQ